jgi:FdhD protein
VGNLKMEIEREIIKVKGNKKEKVFDCIVVERKINIYLNKKLFLKIMCLPVDIKELIYGLFFSNGYILNENEIKGLKNVENNWFVEIEKEIENKVLTIGSSCFSSFFNIDDIIEEKGKYIDIEKIDILKIMKEFGSLSRLYKKTGGVHSAGISDGRDIYFLSEDIGRHNAIDKVIGKAILNNFETEGKILLTSGRISSEIVFKAKRAKFSSIFSFSAPTSLAIELAEKFKILLVGFIRGERFNIYTGRGIND